MNLLNFAQRDLQYYKEQFANNPRIPLFTRYCNAQEVDDLENLLLLSEEGGTHGILLTGLGKHIEALRAEPDRIQIDQSAAFGESLWEVRNHLLKQTEPQKQKGRPTWLRLLMLTVMRLLVLAAVGAILFPPLRQAIAGNGTVFFIEVCCIVLPLSMFLSFIGLGIAGLMLYGTRESIMEWVMETGGFVSNWLPALLLSLLLLLVAFAIWAFYRDIVWEKDCKKEYAEEMQAHRALARTAYDRLNSLLVSRILPIAQYCWEEYKISDVKFMKLQLMYLEAPSVQLEEAVEVAKKRQADWEGNLKYARLLEEEYRARRKELAEYCRQLGETVEETEPDKEEMFKQYVAMLGGASPEGGR